MKGALARIFPWSLLAIGVVLLINDRMIVPFILLALISSIPFWEKPSFSRRDLPLYALAALVVMYALWLLFSENMDYGRRDVESKLSFLIFPLMFLLSHRQWTTEFTGKVKDGIILGVACSMAISFGRAFWCTWNGGEICFRNDQFGFNMHATYLSLMYVFAALLVVERKLTFKFNLVVKIVYTLLVLIAVFYMRSLSTLIAMGVLLAVGSLWWIVTKRRWLLLASVPLVLALGYLLIQRVPAVRSDLIKTADTVNEYFTDPEKFVQTHQRWNESNTVRIIVWKFSSELISSVPTGVGTGDVKDELFRVYRSHGYDLFAEKELNSHDQFLQTGVALGFTGILLLLTVFAFAWKKVRENQDLILNAFLILTFITCLFESYLERQVGIIFFSFLLSTLLTDWKVRNRQA
jgi:O-antigen ligase